MTEPEPDLADLLPEDLLPAKHKATPLRRTPAQARKQAKALARREEEQALADAQTQAEASAARLAQVVNLHIAGYSLSQIGASIGATADEVDRMLATDAARYVRSQPALRVFVRNWISERYTKLIEADWDEATNKKSREKLENQDRVIRILERMTRLHGAEAPTQTEVKVEAAPEAVEQLVNALAAGRGLNYDTSVFDSMSDIVDAEIVADAASQSASATLDAGEAVGEDQPGDAPLRAEEDSADDGDGTV